jgi:hypothetical protein
MAKILIKRSSTSGQVPSTSDLDLGEFGINTHDGKVYIKKDDGSASIIEIGGDAAFFKNTSEEFTATSGQTTFTTTGFTGTAVLSVFQNGILLATSEYNTSTPDVTLNTGATVNDIITVKILDLGV